MPELLYEQGGIATVRGDNGETVTMPSQVADKILGRTPQPLTIGPPPLQDQSMGAEEAGAWLGRPQPIDAPALQAPPVPAAPMVPGMNAPPPSPIPQAPQLDVPPAFDDEGVEMANPAPGTAIPGVGIQARPGLRPQEMSPSKGGETVAPEAAAKPDPAAAGVEPQSGAQPGFEGQSITGDLNDPASMYQRGLALQADAERERLEAEGKRAAEAGQLYAVASKAADDTEKEIARREAENQQTKAKMAADRQREFDAYTKMEVRDPWAQKSTGSKVLAGISLALAGIGDALNVRQGVKSDAFGRAMQIIDAAIAQDIAIQKDNIAKKRGEIDAMDTAFDRFVANAESETGADRARVAAAWANVAKKVEGIEKATLSDTVRSKAKAFIGVAMEKAGAALSEWTTADHGMRMDIYDRERQAAMDEQARRDREAARRAAAAGAVAAARARAAKEEQARRDRDRDDAREDAKEGLIWDPSTGTYKRDPASADTAPTYAALTDPLAGELGTNRFVPMGAKGDTASAARIGREDQTELDNRTNTIDKLSELVAGAKRMGAKRFSEYVRNDPEGKRWAGLYVEALSEYVRSVSGAAVTDAERQFLKGAIPERTSAVKDFLGEPGNVDALLDFHNRRIDEAVKFVENKIGPKDGPAAGKKLRKAYETRMNVKVKGPPDADFVDLASREIGQPASGKVNVDDARKAGQLRLPSRTALEKGLRVLTPGTADDDMDTSEADRVKRDAGYVLQQAIIGGGDAGKRAEAELRRHAKDGNAEAKAALAELPKLREQAKVMDNLATMARAKDPEVRARGRRALRMYRSVPSAVTPYVEKLLIELGEEEVSE